MLERTTTLLKNKIYSMLVWRIGKSNGTSQLNLPAHMLCYTTTWSKVSEIIKNTKSVDRIKVIRSAIEVVSHNKIWIPSLPTGLLFVLRNTQCFWRSFRLFATQIRSDLPRIIERYLWGNNKIEINKGALFLGFISSSSAIWLLIHFFGQDETLTIDTC